MSTLKNSESPTSQSQNPGNGHKPKVGCIHNARREFFFGVQTGIPRYQGMKKPATPSYGPGDLITLRCPVGCPDICIQVK